MSKEENNKICCKQELKNEILQSRFGQLVYDSTMQSVD